MRRPTPLELLAIAALQLTLACGGEPAEMAPPEIHYGQDVCAECSMIVSEERFAGAIGYRRPGKSRIQYLYFDDIGEMLLFEPPAHDEIRWYVHDTATSDWLVAEDAHFVRAERLVTPMGTGVGAYSSLEAAQAALEEFGGVSVELAELKRAGVPR